MTFEYLDCSGSLRPVLGPKLGDRIKCDLCHRLVAVVAAVLRRGAREQRRVPRPSPHAEGLPARLWRPPAT